jgi:hypothetical protein
MWDIIQSLEQGHLGGKEDEISIFSDHGHNLDSIELWDDMFG